MSYLNDRIMNMKPKSTMQDFSSAIEAFPEGIQSYLIEAKMRNDALIHELNIIEQKITKAKAEVITLKAETEIAKAANTTANTTKANSQPSRSMSGVMAILLAKHSK